MKNQSRISNFERVIDVQLIILPLCSASGK